MTPNRRAFLSLSAFTPFAHLLPVSGQTKDVLFGVEDQPRELKADLVVVGAGVGGIAHGKPTGMGERPGLGNPEIPATGRAGPDCHREFTGLSRFRCLGR